MDEEVFIPAEIELGVRTHGRTSLSSDLTRTEPQLGHAAHAGFCRTCQDGLMDYQPRKQTPLRDAHPCGVYENPTIGVSFLNRELLLREHMITSLYWFGGKNPLHPNLFARLDDVLPTAPSRQGYLKHYRTWGQQMTQARIEGLAIPVQEKDYILPNAEIVPPPFHYSAIALSFILQHYGPDAPKLWCGYDQDDSLGYPPQKINKATVRVRELTCLLGIFLEACQEDVVLTNYSFFLERAIFALLAYNPVIRLGLPGPFGQFVSSSMWSLTAYFYQEETKIRAACDLPSSYLDQILECAAEFANLLPYVEAYSSEDCV
jgi:hypothetical protein